MSRVSGRHNGKELYFSHGSNHSRGVAILVRDELDLNLNSASSDDDGRFVMIEAELQGSSFLFLNIYAPNSVQGGNAVFTKS